MAQANIFLKTAVAGVLICIIGLSGTGGLAVAASLQTPAITVYQGQGVDANFIDLLPNMVTNDLRFEGSYFIALGYYHPLTTPLALLSVFDFLHIPGTETGVEFIAAKHHGLQHNGEADVAYSFRFQKIQFSDLTVRFGMGLGLSYALGRPTYEDGSREDPDKRYRFQHYGAYELAWGVASAPRFTLVTRIHHRSGVYGLIAPRHVGSNFLTLGLRYAFF